MDADPGQQWGLLILALVLMVLGFCFAIYERALKTTTNQALESASESLPAKKKEKVAGLIKKLPHEFQMAQVARLTACLLALIFLATAVFLALGESLTSVLVSGIVLGVVARIGRAHV